MGGDIVQADDNEMRAVEDLVSKGTILPLFGSLAERTAPGFA